MKNEAYVLLTQGAVPEIAPLSSVQHSTALKDLSAADLFFILQCWAPKCDVCWFIKPIKYSYKYHKP